jgi:hypothetical protein
MKELEKLTKKAEQGAELLEKSLDNSLNTAIEALNKQQAEINYWKNQAESKVFCDNCQAKISATETIKRLKEKLQKK